MLHAGQSESCKGLVEMAALLGPRVGQASSGKHSDQGSMIAEIHQDIRSRKTISGHPDRVLAQNVDAVLAGTAMWAGDITFAKCCRTQVYTFL